MLPAREANIPDASEANGNVTKNVDGIVVKTSVQILQREFAQVGVGSKKPPKRLRSHWEIRRKRGFKSMKENRYYIIFFCDISINTIYYWLIFQLLLFQVAHNLLGEAGGGWLAQRRCHHHPHHLHQQDHPHHHQQQETSASAHYIKLHAPWSLLCRLAEELNLRAPLQVLPTAPLNAPFSNKSPSNVTFSPWIYQKL